MSLLVGYVIILLASIGTYSLHGNLGALWVPVEYVAIIGLMIGGFVASNGSKAVRATLGALPTVLKGSAFNKALYMMVTEYSKRTLGFLVHDVDRIIRVDWDRVRAPDSVTGGTHVYITAITELDNGKLVSIVDVEQIMANTFGEAMVGQIDKIDGEDYEIFFVDDSAVARKKIAEVLEKMGVRHKHALNGMEAWTRLSGMAAHAQQTGTSLREEVNVILVDAEMPEMDGYVLTKHIKSDKRFDGIPVVMHSSLSSEANRAMGKSVGVDAYVAKFNAEALAETLRPLLLRSHRD